MSVVIKETVRMRIQNYEADGIDGFLPYKNRVYNPELKHAEAEKNVLNRRFRAAAPSEKRMTEITEFNWYRGLNRTGR